MKDPIKWELLQEHEALFDDRENETPEMTLLRLYYSEDLPPEVKEEVRKAADYFKAAHGGINKPEARRRIKEALDALRAGGLRIKEALEAEAEAATLASGDGAAQEATLADAVQEGDGLDAEAVFGQPALSGAGALSDEAAKAIERSNVASREGQSIYREFEAFKDRQYTGAGPAERVKWNGAERILLANKSPNALAVVMAQAGILYRYNMRSFQREVLLFPECELISEEYPRGKWFGLTDAIEKEIWGLASEEYLYKRSDGKYAPLHYGRDARNDVLDRLDNREAVNEVKEYFAACENAGWDGEERAATWFVQLLGAEDNPITRAATLALLGGAVTRTFRPGAKFDVCPLFTGPDGIGKSSAPKWLLPPERQEEWFNDNFMLDADHKTQVESVLGSVFVEIAEMGGSRRAERDRTKALLSRTADKVRLAYGRNRTDTPRQFVFFGTSNDKFCVPADPTGGLRRRFAIMVCTGRMPLDEMQDRSNKERIQVWAEVMHKFRRGDRFYIHGAIEQEMRMRTMEHMDEDTAFLGLVDGLDAEARPLIDLMDEAGLLKNGVASRADQHRFRDALDARGWIYAPKQERWRGRVVRLWKPPAAPEDSKVSQQNAIVTAFV